ncbi:MAG: polysaccharide deacetylase [Rhizobiaceae bacterium]
MLVVRGVSILLSALAAMPATALAGALPLHPQYVIVSFDGAHDVAQWKRSRALAERTGARFTYFLSCVFLVTKADRAAYVAPGQGTGKSNVGFAHDRSEVAARLTEIWTARQEGHEMASHGCGHFDGSAWTVASWRSEFDAFSTIIGDAWSRYGDGPAPDGWRTFVSEEITGFRAPYLATGAGLFRALAERGFAYDASGVSSGPATAELVDGVERFALPQIPEGPNRRGVIAMDYNLFVRHSAGIERTDEDGAFERRTYDAFTAAFREQYEGERIPLQLGFHFTLMNGGAYWRALERFAGETCGKPQVVCTSYADYLRRTTSHDPKAADVGG